MQMFSDDQMQAMVVLIKNAVNEAVQPRFDSLEAAVGALRGDVDSLKVTVGALRGDVDSLKVTVGALRGDVDSLKVTVGALSGKIDILMSKSLNSTLDSGGTIAKVSLISGIEPTSEYPRCIYSLVVAGNERLPDDSSNSWNAVKSLELIREYDPGYETDGIENFGSARKRRLVLAKHLGITPYQLDSAVRGYYS